LDRKSAQSAAGDAKQSTPGWRMLSGRYDHSTANGAKSILIGVIVAVFSLWEGGQPFTTTAAHISIGLAIVAIAIITIGNGLHRQEVKSMDWLRSTGKAIRSFIRRPNLQGVGVAIWLLLFLAVFGWDLNSFLRQQADLPTLSRIVGDVTRHYAGRAILVVAWLAGGWYLVAGQLTKRTNRRHIIGSKHAD
jgi:tellurite resistance protein TehA-like permease